MAAVVIPWLQGTALSEICDAMQNAVPSVFKKVELAEDPVEVHLFAYDSSNNLCLKINAQNSVTLYFRDGSSYSVNNFSVNYLGVCRGGVILYRNDSGHVLIAKDHRGKVAFVNTSGGDNSFIAWNGDTEAYEAFGYGDGQQKTQTNLTHMLVPMAAGEANWMDNAFVSIQYQNKTDPQIVTIDGSTYIMARREYLKDS